MRRGAAVALAVVNAALRPVGLVLRASAHEAEAAAVREATMRGYWEAAGRARRDLDRSRAEVARLRRHLRELDVLVPEYTTPAAVAARRVLDAALGRDVDRAA